ncbi:hypothetical protein [Streptococcus thermophilus]|uniref:hypothetical protein n=1 Tax=Streptococcus thermophilus TaxID=1308 RepID=UPI001FA38AA6|nr:hypothetical protein [Streptococcus thermophilus]MCE2103197.1 hypothetical protein [Streptococcus thermophilus]MCE2108205.1 hypothetical protein [Streptococcus thermophilus]MCE2112971.1 hypothetical protein [Streptococcus thermophilus]MCE2116491.1 hypothetical protein [Streptococcus thermophilus]MCE2124426.1 hypothetical protein [Streptococcus thermophilus]
MIWELDTLYSDEVEEREHITLDFVGRIIQVTVGKVQSPPPWEEVISKWGSQDKQSLTLRFLDGSLQLRYIDLADP